MRGNMAGTGKYKVTVTVTDKDTGRTVERSLTTGSEMVEDPGAWARTMHTSGCGGQIGLGS
jgi:hypothetical protein